MFELLKKAGEYLAPVASVDTLTEIKNACSHASEILDGKENELTLTLDNTLIKVIDYLTEEIGSKDMPCFDFITQINFTPKLANSFSDALPNGQIIAILKFFISFLNTKLNIHYAQISINYPFAIIVSKLRDIYFKMPNIISDFILEIWNHAKKSPLVLDMMVINDGKTRTYPLLDLFSEAFLQTDKIGIITREALLFLFSPNETTSSLFDPSLKKYISNKVFPSISKFIINACECSSSIQFQGAASTMVMWCDQFLLRVSDYNYDASEIITCLTEFDDKRKLLSVSFLLASFSCPSISKAVVEFASSSAFIEIVAQALKGSDGDLIKMALLVTKQMLLTDALLPSIVPRANESDMVDLLPLMPPTWLVEFDDETKVETYESSSASLIQMFGSIEREPGNDLIFKASLDCLKKSKDLNTDLLGSLTELIWMFVGAEGSLSCKELGEAFEAAIEDLKDIETFALPKNEEFWRGRMGECKREDRAAILGEFGKEMHAMYLAHEKLSAIESMYEE